ncbi:MAG: trypsin-like peptidase domain-containing protein [Verrucomicrobiaceae bacterium]|nr:trypsin-like peptidase domain-containing protein [Verrucomicrobiaceae bacterium]
MRPFLLLLSLTAASLAQSPGVPVYPEGRGSKAEAALIEKASALHAAKSLLTEAQRSAQMQRKACSLALPTAATQTLSGRERWQRARAAHLRVGHLFLCNKCDEWHLNLAGGFIISSDGAVGTCAHVLTAPAQSKESYLVAATDMDEVLPVSEILAVNPATDSAILRVKSDIALTPLPLATDTSPGDDVWCFSDPSGARGYYSEGIVSRFVQRPFLRKREREQVKDTATAQQRPVWLETTLDWAPGSSGSALIDQCGNCVGHVSEIQAVLENTPPARAAKKKDDTATKVKKEPQPFTPGTYIVFHHAIAVAELRKLIQEPKKP